jgi:hypothetical protein
MVVKIDRRPIVCPSNYDGTQCRVHHHKLVLLDNQRARVLNFDRQKPSKPSNKKRRSHLLDLPPELRQKIFSYLLVAPAEIFMGVVVLERRPPHHFHPHKVPKTDMHGFHPQGPSSLVRTPVCAHKRAAGPLGLGASLLRVNKQLHDEAARTLYSGNAFAVDLAVPETPGAASQYDVAALDLEDLIPANPAYHKLLRTMDFRCFNEVLLTYPVRFFHAAMMQVLRDMPGAYAAFRRCYDPEHEGFDFEVFAGWSGTAMPAWLDQAFLSLSGRRPLLLTTLRVSTDDAHWNMSNLWEKVRGRTSTPASPQDESSDNGNSKNNEDDNKACLDLQVFTDPAVYARKWHPQDPQSWRAGRIFLLCPPRINNKKESEYKWRLTERPRAGIFRTLSHRLQTNIIGVGRACSRNHTVRRQSPAGTSTPPLGTMGMYAVLPGKEARLGGRDACSRLR